MTRQWSRACLLTLVVSAALVSPTYASTPSTPACAALQDPTEVPVTDARLLHTHVAGTPVDVLLPPGYANNDYRYPVLFLMHGAFDNQNQFTATTDLISYTAGLPTDEQAIVVMPYQSNLPAASDWHDGSRHQETFLVHQLVPAVDAQFRTRGDGAHRAIAGFSGGGLDAMLLAARHPGLFAAAGSFSGFVDQLTPRGIAVIAAFTAVDSVGCGNAEGLDAIWGNPILDRANWIAHDPTNLAARLRGTVLYIASGNGVSCPNDPQPASLEGGLVEENTVHEMSRNLANALTRDGIPHTEDFYGCGSHIARYVQRDLHVFWPIFARTVANADRA